MINRCVKRVDRLRGGAGGGVKKISEGKGMG